MRLQQRSGRLSPQSRRGLARTTSRASALLGNESSINDASVAAARSFDQLIDQAYDQAGEDSFASPEDDSVSNSRTIDDAESAQEEEEEDAFNDQAAINQLAKHETESNKSLQPHNRTMTPSKAKSTCKFQPSLLVAQTKTRAISIQSSPGFNKHSSEQRVAETRIGGETNNELS